MIPPHTATILALALFMALLGLALVALGHGPHAACVKPTAVPATWYGACPGHPR